VKQAKQALFLVFRIGSERYALQATEVAEVLPRLPLKPIAQAPHWVAGVFAYRGAVVPVIDLCALTFGTPARREPAPGWCWCITARMTAQRRWLG
jgi:chemotaxis-related protein WspB